MSEILAHIARLLGLYRPTEPERRHAPDLSIEGVEQLISLVGRERVFERAKALGWAGDRPPLWVWNAICQELIAEQPKTPAQIQFIEHVTKH